MAIVFAAPTKITLPKMDFRDIQGYRTACDAYLVDLKKFIVDAHGNNPVHELVGGNN